MNKMLNIGHRGAKGFEPENTLISFQTALDLNADGVEFDVHVCKSGELIVIHDFTVDRTTNGTGAVSDLTLSELKKLRINGSIEIPTLEEVLLLFNKKHFLNIELKGTHTAKLVCDCIEKNVQEDGFAYSNFIVSSFQRDELESVANYNAKIPLGILTQASVEQALEWAEEFSATAIHPHFSLLTTENVALALQKGYQIYTWTVNEFEDIQRVKEFGINGIITDFSDRI
ncbi:glycerophosphodiester phosphodiesterase family protein [Flavobacterium antarcticum]|uniref:glycerophosphodiester phosphodiesterase n=1 Tax=Flavobacterium antarcticum TaxID=271155 RepID=UPI0003B71CEE|nr:glycerophosphodiester phosphodiesterase family protein [Flavobacterium antarcticum]